MKKQIQWLAMAGVATLALFSAGNLLAQDNPPPGGARGSGGRGGRGGGNFDPAQFQQMRLERYRQDLDIKDDAEWKAIEPLVTKVMDAQRDAFSGMGRGMFGRGGRSGGDNNSGDPNAGRRPRFGPEPSEADQALEKAIDDKNATKDQLKSAMAKVRAEKKGAQTKLTAAQEELKKVLSTKQEAVALTLGLVQ
jgi:hypothetical protein